MRILITIALFFSVQLSLFAQHETQLTTTKVDQARIEFLANSVLQELPKHEKDSLNQLLIQELPFDDNLATTFRTNFNEVKSISILTSPDSAFRIFNWEMAYLDGTNRYECFIIKNIEGKLQYDHLQASDSTFDREKLINKQLGAKNWLPALYYEIIPVKSRFQTFYTLLGWDGNDVLTNKKYIEVLWFDKTGKIHFGAPIFKDNRSVQSRVVFEYGGQNAMNLNYENQLERVSFSHLAPPSSTLEGVYEYYGADVTFDAYEWKGKYWQFISEVIPAWADPKGRTEVNISKKAFNEKDAANPNAASKVLKEAEKRKKIADDKLKEEKGTNTD